MTLVYTVISSITRQQLSQHWKYQTVYEINPWGHTFSGFFIAIVWGELEFPQKE